MSLCLQGTQEEIDEFFNECREYGERVNKVLNFILKGLILSMGLMVIELSLFGIYKDTNITSIELLATIINMTFTFGLAYALETEKISLKFVKAVK